MDRKDRRYYNVNAALDAGSVCYSFFLHLQDVKTW
jgi:hypothetical protein